MTNTGPTGVSCSFRGRGGICGQPASSKVRRRGHRHVKQPQERYRCAEHRGMWNNRERGDALALFPTTIDMSTFRGQGDPIGDADAEPKLTLPEVLETFNHKEQS